MKKTLAMLLVIAMIFSVMTSLSACYDPAADDFTMPPDSDNDYTVSVSKPTGTLVFDNEYISVYFQNAFYDTGTLYYKLVWVNKTDLSPVISRTGDVYLDDVSFPEETQATFSPIELSEKNEKKACLLTINGQSIRAIGMDHFSQISVEITGYESKDSDAVLFTDVLTFQTGKEVDTELDLKGRNLHNAKLQQMNITFTLVYMRQDTKGNIWVYFYIENSNDFDITILCPSFNTDGLESGFRYVIPANSKMCAIKCVEKALSNGVELSALETITISYQVLYTNHKDAPDDDTLIYETEKPLVLNFK